MRTPANHETMQRYARVAGVMYLLIMVISWISGIADSISRIAPLPGFRIREVAQYFGRIRL